MSDPYRLADADTSTQVPNSVAGKGFLNTLLWAVLVVSVVGNTVSSFAGVDTMVHLGFGLVSAACVAALTGQYLRARR